MSRLRHSFKAYRRYMQISTHSVFVFVEGKKVDPYFFGKVSDSVCQSNGITYFVSKAHELSNSGGGKQVLLSFFQYLKRNAALIDHFKGKTTAAIFFLDKDIDDMLHTKRHSPHLVYTVYYDIYNHIFLEGNLPGAIAAAASLDQRRVESRLGNCCTLRYNLAELWKDWVKLCLFAAKNKINSQANYRITSKVNDTTGAFNKTSYAELMSELKSELKVTDRQFNKAFQRLSKIVDDMYSRGLQDRIFKGKWYCYLFAAYLQKFDSAADCNGLDSRLPSCIAVTLDFNQPWADYFKQPLQQLVQKL